MKVNTTGAVDGRAPAMSEGAIERAFQRAAGQLEAFAKRAVRVRAEPGASDVVELGYNGRMFLIRRGEAVELPIPLCEILEQAGLI